MADPVSSLVLESPPPLPCPGSGTGQGNQALKHAGHGPFHFQHFDLVRVILSIMAVSLPDAGLSAESPLSNATAEFREQLSQLATKCDELGLSAEAAATRGWWLERAQDRQYLFVPRDEPRATDESDVQSKWRAKFRELRSAYAAKLWEQARREATSGSGTTAFQLLHEILRHDPEHAEAKRVLQLTADERQPRARQPNAAHPKFGWQRGRWWQITSPHFQIHTDAGQAAGLELARQLEDFHCVWRQLFFDYWSSREELAERMQGKSFRPPSERKHQVVLFRDREQYLRQLTPIEPKIQLTLGYYLKGNQTSYFYAGDASTLSVWYHEAAHQLFQETGRPVRDVGEKWNFWIVEGIAVYLESAAAHDGYFTVGGFDADRLQFVRSRVMGGDRLLPVGELSRLGREAMQSHPDIRRLYTQAAGLTHYLMDADRGEHRAKLVEALIQTYSGKDSPETLAGLAPFKDPAFPEKLREFLTVSDADLDDLRPIPTRKNLSLAGGKVTDDGLRRLAGNMGLEWIDLAYTGVTDEGVAHLRLLPKLQRLTLVNTRVTDEVGRHLRPPALPALEELDLSGTAVSDASLADLKELVNLKVLRLSHTGVSDAGIEQLTTLRNLEELDVEHTNVTPTALERLKARLPKLDPSNPR